MKIKAAKVFLNGSFQSNQLLSIKKGYIQSIEAAQLSDSYDFAFSTDYYLIPGMIDLHIHGASGADVMDGNPASLSTIAQTLAAEGVTGFLATTMTESVDNIEAALLNGKNFQIAERADPCIKGSEMLGFHLEGPFLSHAYIGAQSANFLLKPDIQLLQKWQEYSGNQIKLITLAPELEHADALIKAAKALHITVSIGHTAATFAEAEQAIAQGASYATHLFNAMSGVHHRVPGAAAAILADDRITAELIADGHHVIPAIVKLAVKCKGLDKLVLVTDAMRAKCLKHGTYTLGGQTVIVDNGVARLQRNGVLAGSVLQLNQALRNFIEFTHLDLADCLPLVTSTPAKILNMENQLGSLTPAKKANFVILDNNLDVYMTFREGQLIYQKGKIS